MLKKNGSAAILISKLFWFKHRDHLIRDYIKRAAQKKSEPIWMSKLKSGKDAVLDIKAAPGRAHNQEVTRLEITHTALALLPDSYVLQHSLEIYGHFLFQS